MNRIFDGVVTGPKSTLWPSTNTFHIGKESDCEKARLRSSVTTKLLSKLVAAKIGQPCLSVFTAATETSVSRVKKQLSNFLVG